MHLRQCREVRPDLRVLPVTSQTLVNSTEGTLASETCAVQGGMNSVLLFYTYIARFAVSRYVLLYSFVFGSLVSA